MKVLHLNTSDVNGGAARAAYRLHKELVNIGVDSQMLVQNKTSDDRTVISPQTKLEKGWAKARPTVNSIPLEFYRQRDRTPYSVQWFPERIAPKIAHISPDIINLHWICGGYLQIETLAKFNKPIVWTLHDMWAFTGGCHYSRDCDRYTKSCGTCPQLHSSRDWDLSRWVWRRKTKAWKNLNLTIVTPSNWLAKCASASSLFQDLPIKVIPNGIDPTRYKPLSQSLAREVLNLPQDKQLVLFGAMNATSDPRKGFNLLMPALQKLSYSQEQNQIELVVFGSSQPSETLDLGLKVHYLGKLNDDISLALLYAAADVFVAPSIQDNLPNTVMEALACGTPCVAFNIGGMPDMIEHKQNGYLAKPFEVEDLARGIAWILEDELCWQSLSWKAREKVEQEFTLETFTSSYLKLYIEILK
ncbi:MAG: glycosyltransferase family 4 protein [Xenococcaceae cyanobacterium MO_188.B29]|nr:glycosyltransferase family 4 protein [Xenococcaceae cyanobacterium MO_188.B29]